MKTLGYPAFLQEALFTPSTRIHHGVMGSGILLVAASVATLGLRPWDVKILIDELLVEFSQAKA